MRKLLAAAAACAALACAAPAGAAPGLLVGVDDDSIKWYPSPSALISLYSTLGISALRVTVDWEPGSSWVQPAMQPQIARIAAASTRLRVVLAVGGPAASPPADTASRSAYCSFVRGLLLRLPAVRDVVVWTEPNSAKFWTPQRGAAAAYEALLAECWDAVHSVRSGANVIAASAPHEAPAQWFAGLGAAYRASGRTLPIFDTVGHNAYPQTSSEAPSARHASGPIDQGDLGRLRAVVRRAFGGTGQPVIGSHGVGVWWMEDGFQSVPDTSRLLYSGYETDRAPVSELRQATQLSSAVALAYCQPDVGAFFNFELRDEVALTGWQSGLLRPDWSPKPAFGAFRDAAAQARAGSLRCRPGGR